MLLLTNLHTAQQVYHCPLDKVCDVQFKIAEHGQSGLALHHRQLNGNLPIASAL